VVRLQKDWVGVLEYWSTGVTEDSGFRFQVSGKGKTEGKSEHQDTETLRIGDWNMGFYHSIVPSFQSSTIPLFLLFFLSPVSFSILIGKNNFS